MDRVFWRRVLDNQAAVPEDHAAGEYLPELLAGLGSLDPVLRDDLCNEVLYYWIRAGHFSPAELRTMVGELVSNLTAGIGRGENDNVFLRTFSALVLRYILLHDAASQVLPEGDVKRILEASLHYLESEQDLRGYVPGKGWAHSVAHSADLLLAVAEHPRVSEADLERLLFAISAKVLAPTGYPYIAHEGFRLSRAVIGVLQRNLVPAAFILKWLEGMGTVPERETFVPGQDAVRYHNTESFLSALHLTLRHRAPLTQTWEDLIGAVEAARLPYTPLESMG